MKNKKLWSGIVASVLVVAVAAGGTYALLSHKTNTVDNKFTAQAGLEGELKEPAWDGITFGGGKLTTEEIAALPGKSLGKDRAQQYTPIQEIGKNPMLRNNSTMKAWMAIKLEGLTNANQYIEPIIFDSNWENITPDGITAYQVYLYKTTVHEKTDTKNGGITTPLFSSITIQNLTAENIKNFDIKATGYAVQGDIEKTVATTALQSMVAK
ncbi:MAG: hypothetical protein RR920_02515 [Lachnospiraceae bacterium]